ncbi:hypothetical protein ATANTOWER_027220 [Ataeniobius toweri]|uniref:Uncharacterized protein n=1 Tax=Ataeniobius toweri TaxID=208326 RepID=A0ABU7CCQ1_9TELE|nr:hypothetical protein [Ataeniobius toweri]
MERVTMLYLWKAEQCCRRPWVHQSLRSTITYSKSCVWMTVASGTSIYPGPNLRTCCPTLEDESASGTPTTGIVSSLQNACPFVFEQIHNPEPEAHHPPSRGPTQPGGPGPGKQPLGVSRHAPKHPAPDTEDHQ